MREIYCNVKVHALDWKAEILQAPCVFALWQNIRKSLRSELSSFDGDLQVARLVIVLGFLDEAGKPPHLRLESSSHIAILDQCCVNSVRNCIKQLEFSDIKEELQFMHIKFEFFEQTGSHAQFRPMSPGSPPSGFSPPNSPPGSLKPRKRIPGPGDFSNAAKLSPKKTSDSDSDAGWI